MSKVIIHHAGAKDSWQVAAATVATGWMPGQAGTLNVTGDSVALAVTDETMFILADDDLELSTPPTGSFVTALYGAGTKIEIDHSAEVAASSATRAYAADVTSAVPSADLYVDSNSKWTSVATGSIKAKLWQVPSAANNYSLGLITRF